METKNKETTVTEYESLNLSLTLKSRKHIGILNTGGKSWASTES